MTQAEQSFFEFLEKNKDKVILAQTESRFPSGWRLALSCETRLGNSLTIRKEADTLKEAAELVMEAALAEIGNGDD